MTTGEALALGSTEPRQRVSAVGALGWAPLLCAALLLYAACSEPAETPRRTSCKQPNVLLYIVDTLRADGLEDYGNKWVETPAANRLAREGTLFQNALAPSSWTRASVASILTGLYPDVHGTEGRNDALPGHVATLAELFSEHGYSTAAVIANPNIGSFYGFEQGFDKFVQLYKRRTPGRISSYEGVVASDEVTDHALEWLDTVGCPFFLLVHTIDPHWPYEPPAAFDHYGEPYAGLVDDDEKALMRSDLSREDRARLKALYHAEIAFNDQSLDRLLSHLSAEGLYEDTVVVLSSDHGEEFWEHGGVMHGTTLFDEAIRVPLIVRYPKAVPVAGRVAEPVSLVDIAPTLLELAGIAAPYALDGRSLLAERTGARPIYSMLDLDEISTRTITRSPWKLIVDAKRGTRSLYNLDLDAAESWNLARQHPERASALASELAAQTRTNEKRRAALRGAASVDEVRVQDLPADARKALEALGYIEPEGP